MKLSEIKQFEVRLTEEEILIEGVLSTLSSAIGQMRNYFTNVATAKQTANQLSVNDGLKGFDQTPVADNARNMRKDCAMLNASASPKVKAAIDTLLTKTDVPKLVGVYLSRNYFKDFMVYYLARTILTLSKDHAIEIGLEIVVDKIVGFALTAVTGIPALDDIKDMAQLGKAAVKVSNDLATRINQLRPNLN